MKKPALLYNGNCSRCSGIATKMHACTEDRIDMISLHDPEIVAMLDEHKPNRKFRPLFVEYSADSTPRISGNLMMGLRILPYVKFTKLPQFFWALAEW